MKTNTLVALETSRTAIETIVREGARKMLQAALEEEVAEFISRHSKVVDADGHKAVVRNGYLPNRVLVTGAGPITIQQPRVRVREGQQRFTSQILPPFLRRLPSVDALIPALYLKGVSTGDFSEALSAILGPKASGLSSTNIVRLKEVWEREYKSWSQRDLTGKRYAYLWADGLYFNVRLEPDRPCLLVLMGATEDGVKELLAISDGVRESKVSWLTILRELKRRGLSNAPKLAIGDGSLGFWNALEEEFPRAQHQRCWVHKTANVLDKLPKSVQPDAKKLIQEMYLSPTYASAQRSYKDFIKSYEVKYPKAVECLSKDESVLFTFYQYPAEHWKHIRTTNPIESTFATVRHRTRQTKGCGSRLATLTMVYKLSMEAAKRWRHLNGTKTMMAKVLDDVRFIDGELKEAAA